MQKFKSISLFGLRIANMDIDSAARFIVERAMKKEKCIVNFVNAHCINVAAKDDQYLSSLKRSQIIFSDGIGMKLSSILASSPVVDNVNGTDLFPLLCEQAVAKNYSFALLGAQADTASLAALKMAKRFPGLRIVYVRNGYFDLSESHAIVQEINNSGADILFVALGVPKQENFIDKWRPELAPSVVIGVGALFDFYSGRIPRAPRWMRKIGGEWFFRLLCEPRRLFGRYVVGNLIFIFRAIYRRMCGKENLRHKSLKL